MSSSDWEWNWWQRWLFHFFMRRGPWIAAAAPFLIGFVILFGIAILASWLGEHRIWPRSPETQWIVVGGEFALIATYLAAAMAMAAVVTKGRYQRLLALHQTMREIRDMSWVEFEQLVSANYHAQGYDVQHVGKPAPDGGVDIILRKPGEILLVQCKHYRDSWVFERPLREFVGLVNDPSLHATGGIFVSCGVFDESAIEYAKRQHPKLQLVAGEELRDMITRAVEDQLEGRVYPCPRCHTPMKPKNGRRGLFLSCPLYPACTGSGDWPV